MTKYTPNCLGLGNSADRLTNEQTHKYKPRQKYDRHDDANNRQTYQCIFAAIFQQIAVVEESAVEVLHQQPGSCEYSSSPAAADVMWTVEITKSRVKNTPV